MIVAFASSRAARVRVEHMPHLHFYTLCQRLTCVRAHPDLNQGPADLQSAALTTELCTQFAMLSCEVDAMSALSAHSCSPCCVPPLAKPLRPTNTWWCPRPWWCQCQQPRLCLLRELPGRHECMAAWSSGMILA